MTSSTERVSTREELRHIADAFSAASHGAGALRMRPDHGFTPDNLCLVLPFFLIEGASFDGDIDAARTMALANANGTAHFLIDDAELDGDALPSPDRCLRSDLFFTRFVRGYAQLFEDRSPFWTGFDRAIEEYYASLRWERDVLRSDHGAEAVSEAMMAATLAELGRKMSPLKATAHAVGLLGGRPGVATAAAAAIEAFHAAYQLADDLDDLEDDTRRGRWSVPLWLIAQRSGAERPSREGDRESLLRAAERNGALTEVTDAIERSYSKALAAAEGTHSPSLRSFLRRFLVRATVGNERVLRRHAIGVRLCSVTEGADDRDRSGARGLAGSEKTRWRDCGLPPPSDVHGFSFGNEGFVYDVASGLFFEADSLTLEVIDCLRSPPGECAIDVLAMDRGREVVGEVVHEVSVLSGEGRRGVGRPSVVAGEPCRSSITTLALDVTDGCNLSCDYCYLGSDRGPSNIMPLAVARSAVDLLLTESMGESRASIVFFGGEPLLALDLIEDAARYARERAAAAGLRLALHTTTNGTLLTARAAERLRAQKVRVLVSIDGARREHDAHRVFPDGEGSYETVAGNVRSLPPGMPVGARVTVSTDSGPLRDIVGHLVGLGFSGVHLAPVSGSEMDPSFAARLITEFEELARLERERLVAGGRPLVGNFADPMSLLESGNAREFPCGAGARYVCAVPDGRLFLCHRFAGDERYVVGDVERGLDRLAIGELLAEFRSESRACEECWARFLCGGPCHFDLRETPREGVGARAPRCRLRRRVYELAMWLLDSIPSRRRHELFNEGGDAA